MKSSLRAFMKGIIDYAGLFPPADLPFEIAIQNFADYRRSEDSWMLSRFIIPAIQLQNLIPYEALLNEGDPFEFSVLGMGTETVSEFQDHLQKVEEAVEQFHVQHPGRVTTEILEIKLPREAVFANDPDLLLQIYEDAAKMFDGSDLTPNQIFLEAFFEENWEKDVGLVLEAINKHNEKFDGENIQNIGYKLRCGGTKAHMFPSVEEVAFALNKAQEYGIAVKCTAGLHHPVRHYADSVKTKMHGFFNVFGGAMLNKAHDLSDEEFLEILNEEDPEHFVFGDDEFSWTDLKVSTDTISDLRKSAIISFGSCSFDEPREDLQKLKLL
jgi:hypothetical protein